MVNWVVDTGLFIHLNQIGYLKLLEHLPCLIIPPSVIKELTIPRISTELNAITRWPNIRIEAPPHDPIQTIQTLLNRLPLHRGELDCLQLAWNMKPCIFLTDDLAARSAAEKLRIEVHGTVGLIAYSVKSKQLSISKAEKALNALYYESNLFITYEIIEQAIQHIRKFI